MPHWRPSGLRALRLLLLALLVWIIRAHHERVRVAGDAPLRVAEVKEYFPSAAALQLEAGGREGWEVLDAAGRPIGYAVRTQPHCRDIIGYCGVTDALIAFHADGRVAGVKIRHSEDTVRHVEDVTGDRHFLKTWNGRNWEEIAAMDLRREGIEGVSGATRTSLAIAASVTQRLAMTGGGRRARPWLLRAQDAGLACLMAAGLLLAFARAPNYSRVRLGYQILVVLYVGFISGDLLAQLLLAGWAQSGAGWRLAPSLFLLAAAAFLVPWATGRPWYCHHFCPYGMMQEWVGKIPRCLGKRPLGVAVAADRWARRLPAALLVVVLWATMWNLPLDLAGLEPFDAFKGGVGATLAIAIAGLAAALAVPQAYCRYGCPTGALLEYLRPRGAGDRLGARDAWAAALVVLAWGLSQGHDWFANWLR